MERFLTRYGDRISGILAGFDRLWFQGRLRSISYLEGMDRFLSSQRVLYKDFGAFAQRLSDRLKAHAEALAGRHGRPYVYLASAGTAKGDVARAIQARDHVTEGLVCVLSCVEACRTYSVHKDRARRQLRLTAEERKCLYLYFYYVDPDWGFLHVRLQTWLPLTIQICVNGRDRLACDLDRAGIAYTRVENAFTQVGDLRRAQALADTVATTWASAPFLTRYAREVNPWVSGPDPLFRSYYWTVREAEYATDVLFHAAAPLAALYPRLCQHAITQFGTPDVLRFLGRAQPNRFTGEAHATLIHRPEGVRVRHWVARNSIKMYDKAGCLLRIETTINNPQWFKVRRRNGRGTLAWLRLRHGVADLRRRAEIAAAANARYLNALAVVGDPTPSHAVLDPVSRPLVVEGRRYRPLRPITVDETALFAVLLRGEFTIQGVRNQDIRAHLAPRAERDARCRRHASSRTTRQLRLLRAHGLLRKVAGTRYYRVTTKGHTVMSTALRFRETDLALLAA